MPTILMTVSVRLPDDEYLWLTEQAAAYGVSRGEFLRGNVRSRNIPDFDNPAGHSKSLKKSTAKADPKPAKHIADPKRPWKKAAERYEERMASFADGPTQKQVAFRRKVLARGKAK